MSMSQRFNMAIKRPDAIQIPCSPRSTFSAVIGNSRMRTPVASLTALAIAAATGTRGGSPSALAP